MRTPTRPIFPLFRSPAQAQVVASLYLGGGQASPSDLARQTGLTLAGISRLLTPLVDAGVLTVTVQGRTRWLSANTDAPFYMALRSLVAITEGPPVVVGAHLSTVDGVEAAFIFGSWAARAMGEPGHMPDDIDVVVVGTADKTRVTMAAARAAEELHREVNAIVVTPDAWDNPTDGFIASVKTRPLVPVPVTPCQAPDGGEPPARTWQDELAEL